MAKVSFENLSPVSENGTYSTSSVSFFNLKNGEEALVRILCDSTDDFDIHTVHNVEMPGFQYGRRMNCLRNPQDPIEACPLCLAKKQLLQRIFIRMIQYTKDAQGNIIPVAKVWERSANDRNFGARALKGYIDNYGPLSDMVCKIIRRGEGLNTEYQFIPALSAQIYRPDLYVKNIEMFEGYSPLGSAILNKNYEELNTFLATGQFPEASTAQATPRTYATPNTTSPSNSYIPAQPSTATPVYAAEPVPSAPPITPTTTNAAPRQSMPWDNSGQTTGFDRPRRY